MDFKKSHRIFSEVRFESHLSVTSEGPTPDLTRTFKSSLGPPKIFWNKRGPTTLSVALQFYRCSCMTRYYKVSLRLQQILECLTYSGPLPLLPSVCQTHTEPHKISSGIYKRHLCFIKGLIAPTKNGLVEHFWFSFVQNCTRPTQDLLRFRSSHLGPKVF